MRSFYQEFKTPIVTIALIFIALFIYTKLAGPIPFYVNSVVTTKTDLFQADGTADITAVPDSATVSFGVTQSSSSVSDAQSKANQAVSKIVDDIKKLGIEGKDIKTTNYSVSPNYSSSAGGIEIGMPIQPGGNNITGYTVTQNIEVKVKPIDKVNNVIDTATKNGANLVGGANFTFSDELEKSLEKQAREKAVANAKEKAQTLAKASGITLGRVVNVVESSNQFPRPMALESQSAPSDKTQTNITPGQNTVTVTVTIYYQTY